MPDCSGCTYRGRSKRPCHFLSIPGLIDLDYGSSISGAPKHTRYFIDFVLDGAILDNDHTVFENDITNVNGVRGLTTMGSFSSPIISRKLTLDPTRRVLRIDPGHALHRRP
jgi:hypothetical protein